MKPRSRRKRGPVTLRFHRGRERELIDGLAKMTKAVQRLTGISAKLEKRVGLLERVVEALSASSDIVKFDLPNDRKSKHTNKQAQGRRYS
jgi:hypothetical protein